MQTRVGIDVTQNGDEHACPFPPVEALEHDSRANTHFVYCRWTAAGSFTGAPVLTQWCRDMADKRKCLPAGTGHSSGVARHAMLALGRARMRSLGTPVQPPGGAATQQMYDREGLGGPGTWRQALLPHGGSGTRQSPTSMPTLTSHVAEV